MSTDVNGRFFEAQFTMRRSLCLPAAVCKECKIGGYEGFPVTYFFNRKSETFLRE
jgi:hypothetical protein